VRSSTASGGGMAEGARSSSASSALSRSTSMRLVSAGRREDTSRAKTHPRDGRARPAAARRARRGGAVGPAAAAAAAARYGDCPTCGALLNPVAAEARMPSATLSPVPGGAHPDTGRLARKSPAGQAATDSRGNHEPGRSGSPTPSALTTFVPADPQTRIAMDQLVWRGSVRTVL
jgi:hypothetical protein